MALHLLRVPYTFSREHKHPLVAYNKLSKSSNSFSSSLSFPISPLSLTPTNTRSTRLLIFQSFSAVEEQSSASSSSPVEECEPEAVQGPRKRLIAQNIPWNCTVEDIRSLFEKHGTVEDVELSMYNKVRNRGLAFVTMGSEEEAATALTALHLYEIQDRVIRVEYATSKKAKKRKSTIPTYDVFVGNLSWKVKSKNLKEFFGPMSPNIVSAEVVYKSDPRTPAGYGFVSFRTLGEAEAAISAFQGKELMGNAIQLAHSRRNDKDELKDGTWEVSLEMNGDGGLSENVKEM